MSLVDVNMIDIVFDLTGESLPADYPFALWQQLIRLEPSLANDERTGVLPLRTAENNDLRLLPKRAKLILRLPRDMAHIGAGLAGAELEVSGCSLILGAGKLRPLQSYSTLHAHLVAGAENESDFMGDVQAQLAELAVQAQTICGKPGRLSDGKSTFAGFSLVLHDLKPDASLKLQCAGMGAARRYGCGVFVPYKVISSLE